jgi:hypothetical protein
LNFSAVVELTVIGHIGFHGAESHLGHRAMAGKRRYTVTTTEDDPAILQNRLGEIAEEGGRVISVTWQPSRTVNIGGDTASVFSGYTIVSEY